MILFFFVDASQQIFRYCEWLKRLFGLLIWLELKEFEEFLEFIELLNGFNKVFNDQKILLIQLIR